MDKRPEPRTPNPEPSCKWITNWPRGERWKVCGPALAAQIAADPHGKYQVRLVDSQRRMSGIILLTPPWAQSFAQKHRAVALALKLSPLDRFRRGQLADHERQAA